MVRECTEFGKDCGNCKYEYTDGMFAPSVWCKLHNPKGSNKADTYMRIDNNNPGTTCDDFELDEKLKELFVYGKSKYFVRKIE